MLIGCFVVYVVGRGGTGRRGLYPLYRVGIWLGCTVLHNEGVFLWPWKDTIAPCGILRTYTTMLFFCVPSLFRSVEFFCFFYLSCFIYVLSLLSFWELACSRERERDYMSVDVCWKCGHLRPLCLRGQWVLLAVFASVNLGNPSHIHIHMHIHVPFVEDTRISKGLQSPPPSPNCCVLDVTIVVSFMGPSRSSNNYCCVSWLGTYVAICGGSYPVTQYIGNACWFLCTGN